MSKEALIIESPEHLLSLMYAMKCESEDRLQDLIDSLRQHNNLAAADIFSRTIKLIKQSMDTIEVWFEGMQLPDIPPWESQWHCEQQPDLACIENAHYLMSPMQALELAICNEKRCLMFLQKLVNSDSDNYNDIRPICDQLELMEKTLVQEMQSWKKHIDSRETEQTDDLDPPNIPE